MGDTQDEEMRESEKVDGGSGDKTVKTADKNAQKKKKKKPGEEEEMELSEEDMQLKENLELMVTRLADGDQGVVKLALTSLMYGTDTSDSESEKKHCRK